jgi:hypothetical protein
MLSRKHAARFPETSGVVARKDGEAILPMLKRAETDVVECK